MKNLAIKFIFCLGAFVLLASGQNWSYTSQSDWTTCDNNDIGLLNAPVTFSTNQIPCTYYSNFNLVLNAVPLTPTWNSTTGNVQFTPTAGQSLGYLYADTPNETTNQYTANNYTAQYIVFHNPSENVMNLTTLDNNSYNMEMQIYFADDDTNIVIMSVIFKPTNFTWQQSSAAYTTALDAMPTDSTAATFNLPNIVTLINNNMNVYVYHGLLSYPAPNATIPCTPVWWFVYAPTLFTDSTPFENFFTLFNALNTATPTTGNFVTTGTATVNGTTLNEVNNNKNYIIPTLSNAGTMSATILRYCWGGYYQLTIPYNYGLWFAIVITILYFILTLWFEPLPVEEAEYTTQPWTHHPWYSIMTVGDNLFTRKSRTALLWVNIINICIFTAIFYAQFGYDNNPANIFLYGLYGCLASIAATYIHGFFLRRYYINKKLTIEQEVLLASLSANDQQSRASSGDIERKIQMFDDRAQGSLFIFYFFVFLWMWGGNAIFIWQMSYLNAQVNSSLSNDWVASFFIAIGLDWLVLDPISALLAHTEFFKNIFVMKGYMYDAEVCHWSYKNQKKMQ